MNNKNKPKFFILSIIVIIAFVIAVLLISNNNTNSRIQDNSLDFNSDANIIGNSNNQDILNCGDKTCSSKENCNSCPFDCGTCNGSGDVTDPNYLRGNNNSNDFVLGAEDSNLTLQQSCGNSICESNLGENSSNCALDCRRITGGGGSGSSPARCGDNRCNGSDNAFNCEEDCDAQLGDSFCTHNETVDNAYIDCGRCGDNVCNGPESLKDCPFDCLSET
ncbi:MAG: hypothetical protein V1824_03165, partial [archaeon]